MSDKPRTLEEAWKEFLQFIGLYEIEAHPARKPSFTAGWHARDEEVAQKDRRIEELEAEREKRRSETSNRS